MLSGFRLTSGTQARRSFVTLNRLQQGTNLHPERICQLIQHVNCGVLRLPLDAADIGPVYPGIHRKALLASTALNTQPTHVHREFLPGPHSPT